MADTTTIPNETIAALRNHILDGGQHIMGIRTLLTNIPGNLDDLDALFMHKLLEPVATALEESMDLLEQVHLRNWKALGEEQVRGDDNV